MTEDSNGKYRESRKAYLQLRVRKIFYQFPLKIIGIDRRWQLPCSSAGCALNPPQTLHNKFCHHQLDLPAVSEPISISLLSFFFVSFFLLFLAVALRRVYLFGQTDRDRGKNVFHLHVLVRPRVMIDDRKFVCRGEREGKRASRTSSPRSGIRTDCSASCLARDSARTCLHSPSCLPRESAPFRSSARSVCSRESDLRDLREGAASRRGSSSAWILRSNISPESRRNFGVHQGKSRFGNSCKPFENPSFFYCIKKILMHIFFNSTK